MIIFITDPSSAREQDFCYCFKMLSDEGFDVLNLILILLGFSRV